MPIPFVEHLGIGLHSNGDGRSEGRVDLEAAHLNTWDVAHGGVVMTLLDLAMATAARSVSASGQGVATVEMKTSFLRPAERGLHARARVLHQTATLAFCEAQVFDDRDHLCASASGTFKFFRGLPRRRSAASDSLADSSPEKETSS